MVMEDPLMVGIPNFLKSEVEMIEMVDPESMKARV